jgi:hypothetical protein
MKAKYLFILFLISLCVFFPLIGQAVAGLEIRYPKIRGIEPYAKIPISEYAAYVYYFAGALLGIVAFVVIISAGLQYLTSAGNPVAQNEAKKRIFSALFGILIFAFGPFILRAISKQILFFPQPTPLPKIEELISPTTTLPAPYEGLWGKTSPAVDVLLYIRNLAQTMRDAINHLQNEIYALKSLLEGCKCNNIKKSLCLFTGKECMPVFCQGEPCPDREAIQRTQTSVKMRLENVLFYGRIFEDLKTKITPEMFTVLPGKLEMARGRYEVTEEEVKALKERMDKLKEPLEKLKEKIFGLTPLANECEKRVLTECKPKCELKTDQCFFECEMKPCEPEDKNPCPMEEVNKLIEEINEILSELMSILSGL